MNFINRENIATSEGFGKALISLGESNNKVVVLGADISSSVKVSGFAEKFPNRFFSMGIAEQNAMGVAAGFSLNGFIPIFSTYGVFAVNRTLDQIRVSVCYNNLHVVIGGAHSGISVGPDGATHQALEDISVMRSLPNMTVISPCDATQTYFATIQAINECTGPVYIRFGREAVADFSDQNQKFTIGKAEKFIYGNDITIFATGHMLWEALQAAKILTEKNISAEVINIHTIKPIDVDAIIESVRKTRAAVTVEEHQIQGGFGSAVVEVISEHYPVPVQFVGMKNCFGESGKPEELLQKYNMKAPDIVDAAFKAIQIKNA